jgi:hypothetical protein
MYRLEPSIKNLELSHGLLDDEMLKYNDDQIVYFLKGLCDQQLGIKNNIDFILDQGDDVLPTVTCVICKGDQTSVLIKEKQSIIPMSIGDVLIFPSEMEHNISNKNNVTVKKIFYAKNVDMSGGDTRFLVSSTLIDKYEIEVMANSEEEAIEKAKLISISKWKHLDLQPEISDRKLIRYAKWFNFDSKPLT